MCVKLYKTVYRFDRTDTDPDPRLKFLKLAASQLHIINKIFFEKDCLSILSRCYTIQYVLNIKLVLVRKGGSILDFLQMPLRK